MIYTAEKDIASVSIDLLGIWERETSINWGAERDMSECWRKIQMWKRRNRWILESEEPWEYILTMLRTTDKCIMVCEIEGMRWRWRAWPRGLCSEAYHLILSIPYSAGYSYTGKWSGILCWAERLLIVLTSPQVYGLIRRTSFHLQNAADIYNCTIYKLPSHPFNSSKLHEDPQRLYIVSSRKRGSN